MINLTDFIHRLAAWRKEQGTLSVSGSGDSAESQLLKLEQRKRFFQTQVVERKIAHLQAMVGDAQSRMKALQAEFLRLKEPIEIKVPVATGEILSFTVQQSVPVPAMAKHQYYDPGVLPQESDDLLLYV